MHKEHSHSPEIPLSDDSYLLEANAYQEHPFQTKYWSESIVPILDRAAERAEHAIAQSSGRVPAWASRVTEHRDEMMSEARLHQDRLISDAEKIISLQQPIEGDSSRSVEGSIRRWYESLGPTETNKEQVPTLLKMVDLLEVGAQTSQTRLLAGNILQDVAMRIDNPAKQAVILLEAQKHYGAIETSKDLSDADARAAKRYRIDCDHLLIRNALENGRDPETGEFDDAQHKKFLLAYESLQKESARAFLRAEQLGALANGEYGEWAAQILNRHAHWADENAEQHLVRGALLREDQAIYPWRVERGMNVIWSFDVLNESLDNAAETRRLQLKMGDFDPQQSRYRVYVPGYVQTVSIADKNLRGIRETASRGIAGIPYSIDMLHDYTLNVPINEKAIAESTGVFAGL